MDKTLIRNFCIIAHIDHGKSTLADRFLEFTGTIEKRKMQNQILDSLELERERGITIKLAPARMRYKSKSDGKNYILNLIDTPGHVDFAYEVSRSLAAVEGAVLLVDATQGIQAQTIANLYLAIEEGLKIIPVINKIDLPATRIRETEEEIIGLLGSTNQNIIKASGKTGAGVEEILERIVKDVPAPSGSEFEKPQALIFDSRFDDYQGVVASVRIKNGTLKAGQPVLFSGTDAKGEIINIGHFLPEMSAAKELSAGEIGYIVAGIKDIASCRVGDTITDASSAAPPLSGYKEIKPMVFAGIFPKEGNEYTTLRKSIEKLKLNDSALMFEPERSVSLGFGWRCGFLGLLHLEIFQERLKREYNVEVTVTVPSVAYEIELTNGKILTVKSPAEFPDASQIKETGEPMVKLDLVIPQDSLGAVMQLAQKFRGKYHNTEYLSAGAADGKNKRVILHYEIPLSSILVNFYDRLKSASQGYGSMNYEFKGYEKSDIVKLDILVAEEKIEALSMLIPRSSAFEEGRRITGILKDTLPKQQFAVKIQAAVGGKIIAAEKLSALRKDVTAKLYGGDVTRKRKLLEKQKKGKKKMMEMGHGKVDIPPKAYLDILKK